jgi:hypothetical protein
MLNSLYRHHILKSFVGKTFTCFSVRWFEGKIRKNMYEVFFTFYNYCERSNVGRIQQDMDRWEYYEVNNWCSWYYIWLLFMVSVLSTTGCSKNVSTINVILLLL